jgi:hypothetical protein
MPVTAPRTLVSRLLSPTGFVLIVILFGLPFLAASCEAPQGDFEFSATFTGIDLVVGGDPDLVSSVDDASEQRFDVPIPVQPLAIIALIAIFAGAGSALLRERLFRHAAGLGLAVLAAGTLAGAEIQALGDLVDKYRPIVTDLVDAQIAGTEYVHTRVGFWVAFYGLVALAIGHAVALLLAWRAHTEPAPAAEDPPPEAEDSPGSEHILSLFDGDDRPPNVI